jgi:SAM-dependent methyltransferase
VAAACATSASPPRILDLGCGEGHITREIQLASGEAQVAGLDYSMSAVARAVELFEGIDFAVGDAYACPYPAGYFDLVVCNNLWEHVPDPLNLLAAIDRVLKPSGHVVISTPSRYSLWNLLKVVRGREVAFMSKHHVTEYTVGQVKEQLRFGGYEVVQTKSRVANRILERIIRMVGSHHRLEQTVFYLARKADERSG